MREISFFLFLLCFVLVCFPFSFSIMTWKKKKNIYIYIYIYIFFFFLFTLSPVDSVTKQAGSSRSCGCFPVCQLLYCAVLLAGIHLFFTTAIWMCLQCDAPVFVCLFLFCFCFCSCSFFFSQIIREPGCANLIEIFAKFTWL